MLDNIEEIDVFSADVVTIDGKDTVTAKCIKMEPIFSKELIEVASNREIGESEEILIQSICFSEDDYNRFFLKQSNYKTNGNSIVVSSRPVPLVKYKGVFNLLVKMGNGEEEYPLVHLGAISFRFEDCDRSISDGIVCFENVQVILYKSNENYMSDL